MAIRLPARSLTFLVLAAFSCVVASAQNAPNAPPPQNQPEAANANDAPNQPGQLAAGQQADQADVQAAPPDTTPMAPGAVLELLRLWPDWPNARVEMPSAVYLEILRWQKLGKIPPPVPFIVAGQTHALSLDKDSAELAVTLRVQVFDPDKARFIQLLPRLLAFRDIKLDGQPQALEPIGAWFCWKPEKEGVFTLTAVATLKPGVDGDVRSAVYPRCASASARITVAAKDPWETASPDSPDKVTGAAGSLVLRPGPTLSVTWRPPLAVTEHEPILSTTLLAAADLAPGSVAVHAQLIVLIRHGKTDTLTLDLPAGAERIDVTGPDVRQVTDGGSPTVHLRGPITGRTRLDLAFEMPRPNAGGRFSLASFGVRGATPDGGYLVLSNSVGGELIEDEARNLDAEALFNLPEELLGLSREKPTLAYALKRGPWALSADLVLSSEFKLPPTLIEKAEHVVVHRPDGNVIAQTSLLVANTARQFLRVQLPPGSKLLLALVDDQSVAITPGKADEIVLPLKKSIATVGGLVSFPVEIIYTRRTPGLGRRGEFQTELPRFDAPIAYATCKLHLPENALFTNWSGPFAVVSQLTAEAQHENITIGRAHRDAKPDLRAISNTDMVDTNGDNHLDIFAEDQAAHADTKLVAANKYRAAVEAYNKKDYEQATILLEDSIQADPQSNWASNARKLLDNTRLAGVTVLTDGKDNAPAAKKPVDRLERAQAAQVAQSISAGNEGLVTEQRQMLVKGEKLAQQGRSQEAAETLAGAVLLGEELQKRGEKGKEQEAVVSRARKGLAEQVDKQKELLAAEKKLAEVQGKLEDIKKEREELGQVQAGVAYARTGGGGGGGGGGVRGPQFDLAVRVPQGQGPGQGRPADQSAGAAARGYARNPPPGDAINTAEATDMPRQQGWTGGTQTSSGRLAVNRDELQQKEAIVKRLEELAFTPDEGKKRPTTEGGTPSPATRSPEARPRPAVVPGGLEAGSGTLAAPETREPAEQPARAGQPVAGKQVLLQRARLNARADLSQPANQPAWNAEEELAKKEEQVRELNKELDDQRKIADLEKSSGHARSVELNRLAIQRAEPEKPAPLTPPTPPPQPGGTALGHGTTAPPQSDLTGEALVDFIKSVNAPETWTDGREPQTAEHRAEMLKDKQVKLSFALRDMRNEVTEAKRLLQEQKHDAALERLGEARTKAKVLATRVDVDGDGAEINALIERATEARDRAKMEARQKQLEEAKYEPADTWRATHKLAVRSPEAESLHLRGWQTESGKNAWELAEGEAPPAEEPSRLPPAMEKPISFDFIATPLDDVVAFLHGITRMNITVDKEAVAGRGSLDVTLRIDKMSVKDALDWIVRLLNLGYTVDENGVCITSAAKAAGQNPPPAPQRKPTEDKVVLQKKMQTVMEQPISFDFIATPLDDVVAFFRGVTRANIIVDKEALAGRSGIELMVTLKLDKMPFKDALEWIVRMVDLGYTVEHGAIFITTKEKAAPARQNVAVTRFYDVTDLTLEIRDFKPDLRAISSSDMGDNQTARDIVNVIGRNISPEAWAARERVDTGVGQTGVSVQDGGTLRLGGLNMNTGGNTIAYRNGKVIVTATPDVQRDVQAFFSNVKANWGQAVNISSYNTDVSERLAAANGVAWNRGANDATYAVVDEGTVRTLLQVAQGNLRHARFTENPIANSAVVGMRNPLANDKPVNITGAQDRGNTFNYLDNGVYVPHDKYLLISNGDYVTVVRGGQTQHWTERVQVERVVLDVAPHIDLPLVGHVVTLEKTLIEPEDTVVLRAEYRTVETK